VTAVRQIDQRTGDERLIRTPGNSFDGRLSAVLLLRGPAGLGSVDSRSGTALLVTS
jgi:hypothetical protein